MAIFTRLASWLNVGPHSELPAEEMAESTGHETRGTVPAPSPKVDAQRDFGKYQPVIEAIHNDLIAFTRAELSTHRRLNPHFNCRITSVEITPKSDEAERLLDELISIHGPGVMARLLKEFAGTLPLGRYIDLSEFAGIVPQPYRRPQHSQTEVEMLGLMQDIQGHQAAPTAYNVKLLWEPFEKEPDEPKPAAPPPAPDLAPAQGSPQAQEESAPRVTWKLRDRQGERDVQVPRSASKTVLGSSPAAHLRVEGTFTSSRHGAVWFDRGSWWYEDLGSTNGSRVEYPRGQPTVVFPNATSRQAAPSPAELVPGCRVVFTDELTGTEADYPVLEIPLVRGAQATPVAGQRRAANATPIASHGQSAGPRPASALSLRIQDANGSRDILLDLSAPFTIGRDKATSCPVLPAHQTVSGRHLEITGQNATGLHCKMLGVNGGFLEDSFIEQDVEFTWPWTAELVLGEKVDPEQVYRLAIIKDPHHEQ